MVESNFIRPEPMGLDSIGEADNNELPACKLEKMRREFDHAGVGQNYVVIQLTARLIFKCWDNAKFSADGIDARPSGCAQVGR